MEMMTWRHSELERTLSGLNETEIPLVSLNNGAYTAAGFSDDLGIYYFIPKIARLFGISIDLSTDLFLGFLIFAAASIAASSFFFFFKHWICRFVSIGGVSLLALATFRYSDVYIAPFFAVASIAPLAITYWAGKERLTGRFIYWLAFSGLIIGYANFIRSHAGTGILIFLISWLFLEKKLPKKEKFYATCILIGFILIPYAHFKHLETNRNLFLDSSNPHRSLAHPKWHSIYIGLGYLKNPYGLEYSDRYGAEKVESVDPKVVFCSPESERILRDECISIAKNNPLFILKNLAAKGALILWRMIFFANFGWLFYFYLKPPLRTMVPFAFAAFFYSLPGLLVIPVNVYLSGLTTLSTLFGIYMICMGVEKWMGNRSRSPIALENG